MNSMDFFGHQEQARRSSARLVWLFVAAVACIVLLIYAAAKATLIATNAGSREAVDWPVLGAVAAGVAVVVGGAMLFKTAQLRGGGGKVARMLGGRLVPIDTQDPQERVLRNVVEEMAIASGVPVPDVYVLDRERGINAFAAGWSTTDAAVAVTRGALEQFDRDELQGVIAHEFSHVFHGDMRLNIRLMGTLFGIICIAVVGRVLVRSLSHSGGGRSDKKGGAAGVVLFGVALIVIGYVGVFFARLIQAAVSRQREFLADASAVQYTRNPRGIGLALAKIAGIDSRLTDPHAEEASHMLFADGVSRFAGGMMATHPPLERRIERVLPGFLARAKGAASLTAAVAETPLPPGFEGGAAAGFAGGSPAARPTGMRPSRLLQTVGDPQPENVARARRLLAALPLDLTVAAHEPARAPGLVLALLLDGDPALREAQVRLIDDVATAHSAQAARGDVAALDRTLRLPLLELAMPALRSLPAAERDRLRRWARALATADGRVTPFEFALLKLLERHLPAADAGRERRAGRRAALLDRRAEAATVLAAIAHAGADDDEHAAEAAYRRGVAALALPDAPAMPTGGPGSGGRLDAAVAALQDVTPLGKRNLLAACAEAAASDGELAPDEVDLIRALGELWDCPVPLPAAP